jgi:hypothetical protein
MAFACNINRQGRWLRGLSGVFFVALGIAILIRSWPPGWWQWVLGIGCVLFGLFQIVEATLGWCAVRAMGFRTPI